MTEPTSPLLPTSPPELPGGRRVAPAWIVGMLLASLVGTLLFVGGYLAAGSRAVGACAAPSEAFAAFCQAYDLLKDQFVDELDDASLAGGAIQGMFEYGVKDPFSGYMTPEDYQRALGDLSGKFSGIGAEMGVENLADPGNLEECPELSDTCALVVIAPLADSPAERAGLKAGDRVLSVDGVSVGGTTIADQIARVRGEAGTEVTLGLSRDGGTFELSITRAEIVSREVDSELLDNNVGYVALHGFSNASVDQFRGALRDLLDEGATSFVFDLRDNPGGYIDAARDIASEFIGDGLIFTQESSGGEVKRWEAESGGLATDPALPLMVLTNGGSASASEIVAAALAERGRATLIGQPTYGKNTVQVWTELKNQGGVRITISRWFTPDHHSVAPDGVQPDILVEVPDDQPAGADPILDRALAELSAAAAEIPLFYSLGWGWSPGSLVADPLPLIAWDAGGQTRALA